MAEKAAIADIKGPNAELSSVPAHGFVAGRSFEGLERRAKAQLSLSSSCGLWLSYLVLTENSAAIAWQLLLGGLMISSLANWLTLRGELEFCLDPRLKPGESSNKSIFQHDREISELVAPILATISIALPVVLTAQHLNLLFTHNQASKPISRKQVVDIELVSPTDAVNRKDFLASSTKSEQTSKHKGALLTVASPRLTGASSARSQSHIEANKEQSQPKENKGVAAAQKNEKLFVAPLGWKTIEISKGNSGHYSEPISTNKQSKLDLDARTFLTEIESTNMIESIDNDGVSPLTIQLGGRSENGHGAPSNLHKYLLSLNKKIKRLWTPPRSVDRVVNIEFRISSDGRLSSCRALNSNGPDDQEAEAAAILAINKAFPTEPLPADFKGPYLDVRYTFNYRLTQIDGIN